MPPLKYPHPISDALGQAPLMLLEPGTTDSTRTSVDLCFAGIHLLYNNLEECHRIAQSVETPDGSYWHAIVHRRERDFSNSKYWLRQVGRHEIFSELYRQATSIAPELFEKTNEWDPFKRREMKKQRCPWCGTDPLYVEYHDTEWGVPLHDDRKLFEMLNLEGAQAGLSWITILRKRQNYQQAFGNFDARKIARYDQRKVRLLLNNEGIVRNRLKIEGAVKNARAFLTIQKEFGTFDKYIWQFVNGKPITNRRRSLKDIPATTRESEAMSKDLKKRGFKFIGSTICYAFMQATGMVNDHLVSCFRHDQLKY